MGHKLCHVAKSDFTETPANLALAAELRAEAAALGLSHRALGEKAGVSYPTVVRTMSAARHTTAGELFQFAKALGMTPAQLADRVVARMGGMDALEANAKPSLSAVPNNVTNLRPDTTDEIDAYQGDTAAYRDEEADTDETD